MLTSLPNRVSALFADPLHVMLRDLDRTLSGRGEKCGVDARRAAPMSVWGDENTVSVEMDVPGIALADLDVSLEHGRLTIKGERKSPDRPVAGGHEERLFGQFERVVELGEWVDPHSIEATLKDGVLSLRLTKKAEAQKQKVAISYAAPAVDVAPPQTATE